MVWGLEEAREATAAARSERDKLLAENEVMAQGRVERDAADAVSRATKPAESQLPPSLGCDAGPRLGGLPRDGEAAHGRDHGARGEALSVGARARGRRQRRP